MPDAAEIVVPVEAAPDSRPVQGSTCHASSESLEGFLQSVERRAFQLAIMATADRDEALDLVQDAMMRLVRRYRRRPAAQWRPLFYRILHNGIMDWHRRRSVRGRWLSRPAELDGAADAPDQDAPGVLRQLQGEEAVEALRQAVADLPARQRQALLLRAWEGMSVAETAQIMGCSRGSVKTHYHRAVQGLKGLIGEHLS